VEALGGFVERVRELRRFLELEDKELWFRGGLVPSPLLLLEFPHITRGVAWGKMTGSVEMPQRWEDLK